MGKGGGGSGGGGGASSGTQETIQREAPGVESRKLALYDEAVKLAQQPVSIPAYQVAGPTGLEQTGFQQAATTGVGQPAVGQGIAGLQAGQQATNVGLGAALAGPNISQFFNPYQSYVTDEINRQAQIAQNQQAAQAVSAGAFGGGREGVQRAELDRARLEAIGQSRAQGFGTALQAAQNLQGLQAQTGLQAGAQFGQLGQALTGVGAQQQAMQQADIQSLLQAGGVQRALGQQALEAQRATSLAQQYEPYQRVEFLKNVMTNLPTGQSSITATTAPGSNPLAQAAGAGLGAYTAYNLLKPRMKEGGLVSIKKFQEGGAVATPKQEGLFSKEEKFAYLAAPVIGSLLQARTAPGQSNLQSLLGAVGEGVSQIPAVGLNIKKIEASADKKTSTKQVKELTTAEKEKYGFMPSDVALGTYTDGVLSDIPKATFDTKEQFKEIRTGLEKSSIKGADEALRSLELTIADLAKKGEGGNLPGIGVIEGRFYTGTQGKNLRAQLAAFSNIRLKDRSGAAVTESEFNRFQEELAGGQTTMDETALLATLSKARAELEKEKVKLVNQFDPRASKAFIEQEGVAFYESPGFIKNKVGAANIPQPQDESQIIDGIRVKFAAGVPMYLHPKDGVYRRNKPIIIKEEKK